MTDQVKDIEAAHVVDVATEVAAERKRLAAFEAAALIDVAPQAHASMGTSPLVVSMFETLQRQMEQISRRAEESEHHRVAMEVNAAQRHGALDAELSNIKNTGEQILAEARRTNGRVTKLESNLSLSKEWRANHDKLQALADERLLGRQDQRRDDLNFLGTVRNIVIDYDGALLGGFIVLMWVTKWLTGWNPF